jgi:pyrroline-5-carboxylate reductase
MRLGFIGTGTMAAAMVEGLEGKNIVVSPRGAEVAAGLALRFPGVTVAQSNQAVVDACDTVVLSIRPQVAEDVVRALRFRKGQRILSLVAATQIEAIRDWVGLDLPITRAIPLPFVASRQGVTPIYPPDAETALLFNRLGTAIECASLAEFDLFAVGSALMGSYFGILQTAQDWLIGEGLPEGAARTYLAALFANLGRVAESGDMAFDELRSEFSTKGGLNEQVVRVFVEKGGATAIKAGLDQVMARFRG